MKLRKVFVVLSLLPLCSLTSCAAEYHIDFLVSGHFTGYTEAGGVPYLYEFDLREIEESAFHQARGVNVIRDALTNACYSLRFSRTGSDRVVKEYTFTGFRDLTPKNEDLAIRYGCDEGAWFSPYTTQANNEPRRPVACGYYFVQPPNDGKEGFSIYLHAREGAQNE